MSRQTLSKIVEIGDLFRQLGPVSIAVSGGVDSLTLAHVAHRIVGANATMFHATSAAVPPEATARTRRHAEQFGWRLEVVNAGEFSDPDYLRNPVNRCFFCKTNLYDTLARHSANTIVSGTNLDDLSDFRPGLKAAAEYSVRHPFVEAQVGKDQVRAIASEFGLDDIAELPASPCLSSRIETGIRVDARSLELVHAVEIVVGNALRAATVRCRIRRDRVSVELDEVAYQVVTSNVQQALRKEVEQLVSSMGYTGNVEYSRYRMGSAFLRQLAQA